MRWPIVCALMVGLSSFCVGARVHLSFDTLFPETAPKQLHDTVLQLWSDLTLLHNTTTTELQKRDLYDLISGQLMRIKYLIEHMQDKNNLINYQDIAHLESIMQSLGITFHDFFQHILVQELWKKVLDGFAAIQLH